MMSIVPLVKQIVRIGGSQGVILDKPLLKLANLDVGQEVQVSVEENRIVITAHRYASDAEFEGSANRTFKKHERALKRLAR